MQSREEYSNYWSPVEAEWRKEYGQQLQDHLAIAEEAHVFVAQIAQHPDIVACAPTSSISATRLLIRRLGEEFRAVELLAINGHGFQAATAACNLFEQSHFLIYVCTDESNATNFLQWTDPHKSPISIFDLVQRSGKSCGWSNSRSKDEYQKYRFLCGFKHNNPVFQGILRLPSDPDLYMSQYALAESLWSLLSAVGLVAFLKLLPQNVSSAIDTCNSLMERVPDLFPKLAATVEQVVEEVE